MGYVRPNEAEVAAKVMEGEAILINLTTGIYYSLDDVGSELWEAIVSGTSETVLADWVVSAYAIEADKAGKDVADFLAALRSENIIVDAAEGEAIPAAAGSSYAPPSFERFDDMAEMFALDPPLPGLATKA